MDYEQWKIKQFNLWNLYLHKNQYPYLGRCYASAIRKDADIVTDMTKEESEELFSQIIPAWHKTITDLFGTSRPNVALFGNEWNHLHAHLIPRFSSKEQYGITFTDPNPKGNYAPYPKREIPKDILLQIKEDIMHKIK